MHDHVWHARARFALAPQRYLGVALGAGDTYLDEIVIAPGATLQCAKELQTPMPNATSLTTPLNATFALPIVVDFGPTSAANATANTPDRCATAHPFPPGELVVRTRERAAFWWRWSLRSQAYSPRSACSA